MSNKVRFVREDLYEMCPDIYPKPGTVCKVTHKSFVPNTPNRVVVEAEFKRDGVTEKVWLSDADFEAVK